MRSFVHTVAVRRLWKALAGALVLAACGGGGSGSPTSSGAGARACTPGAQLSCACPGGQQGIQLCKPDGSGLDPCEGCSGASCPQSAQKLYYHDADQDSYGGTDTMMACEPPGPYWVLQGGDCDDANPLVHPGQTTYFSQPYDRGGSPSFDYDCDGKEDADPSATLASQLSCTPIPGSAHCAEDAGYLPATPLRAGVGVDAYCGSTNSAVCENKSCMVVNTTTQIPLGCR
jgi:hypothetical protein